MFVKTMIKEFYLSNVLVTTFDCWLTLPNDFFLGSEPDLGSFLEGCRCLVGASGTLFGPPFCPIIIGC